MLRRWATADKVLGRPAARCASGSGCPVETLGLGFRCETFRSEVLELVLLGRLLLGFVLFGRFPFERVLAISTVELVAGRLGQSGPGLGQPFAADADGTFVEPPERLFDVDVEEVELSLCHGDHYPQGV